MTIFTYLSFAVSPLILILLTLYFRFKFSIQSLARLRSAVFYGMVGVVLLVIATYFIELQWHDNLRNMRRMAFFVFIIVAFSSEFAKFLALRYGFLT